MTYNTDVFRRILLGQDIYNHCLKGNKIPSNELEERILQTQKKYNLPCSIDELIGKSTVNYKLL